MKNDDRIVRLLEVQKALNQMKCLEMDEQSIHEVQGILDKIPTLISRIEKTPEGLRSGRPGGTVSSRLWVEFENETGEKTMTPVNSLDFAILFGEKN
jgi:hypothetical protein